MLESFDRHTAVVVVRWANKVVELAWSRFEFLGIFELIIAHIVVARDAVFHDVTPFLIAPEVTYVVV